MVEPSQYISDLYENNIEENATDNVTSEEDDDQYRTPPRLTASTPPRSTSSSPSSSASSSPSTSISSSSSSSTSRSIKRKILLVVILFIIALYKVLDGFGYADEIPYLTLSIPHGIYEMTC
ncbi:unnamed protein product [Rotaria sp. Silwood1]|nr:unnamed protein product [Rotaria sp. Silwood1]CAF0889624.1 unnamed protein product [Rotaria sp. Silwood1]CAF0903499.1 unnamed protein product [Rotaria sp. Silwood1]CAF3390770.1 unnamed protein product [Rotaria sp. Silwood1]CAF4844138.1 unnamed protein product [Rotaria sp. Silwood1]